MPSFWLNFKIGVLAILFLLVGFTGFYELLKPVPNGCVMTYMYPTYIPISTPADASSQKYGIFLYHEGWKKIDFAEHVKNLDGIPVLFIPGNGGSYKQVRSLASESSRAYQGGPPEETFYQEASFQNVGVSSDYPTRYKHKLNWFAVDLEGEHSAMDGRILLEHTEYVVYSIHRVLDLYQDSRKARVKEGADVSGSLPSSVILVGHSMGGFVARAAVIHPGLRKSTVETIITLSSPHQAPPIALQPSLGHYFSQVNHEWKKGFMMHSIHSGQTFFPGSELSHVLVVSISGGFYDYQVRSKLTSLDGIVPSTNGFMISSSSMKNVWCSMEHQTIVWCNQVVVQLSHALLSLINSENGQPFSGLEKRLFVLTRMLQSSLPQNFGLLKSGLSSASQNHRIGGLKDADGLQMREFSSCPSSFHWKDDVYEKDLYIHSTSVTVLAMDGRRRWLDIRNLSSNGKEHFIFVTNLAPCSGVRLHLWPEKLKSSTGDNLQHEKRILEVTSKMAYIPTGPAPRQQIEPGSQTEQAPPSSVLLLRPEELRGFQFITISVAPRPTVSGRPPPAVSMAVGQFFNPKDGERDFSPSVLLRTIYSKEEIFLKEDHPLALNFSFSVSLGLLPVSLSLQTEGCGLKDSTDHVDQSRLCRARCFPPIGLAWDSVSGLHVIPNIYSEIIIVDSSPVMWDSGKGSDSTLLFLLADPHCSYKIDVSVSLTAAANRFYLLYSSQVIGLMVAVALFALMRQAYTWELDLSLPSILTVVELNLRIPRSFLLFAVLPIFASLSMSWYTSHDPLVVSYITISIICYLIANGFLIILILSSLLIFYVSAVLHIFIKRRWLAWQESMCATFFSKIIGFLSFFLTLKVMQILSSNSTLIVGIFSISLVCFVHPALGLIVLLFYHYFHCHVAFCSFLATSFRSNAQREFVNTKSLGSSLLSQPKSNDASGSLLPIDDSFSSSPNTAEGYGESQLEIFNYQHGILTLHLLATVMFIPSLVAWLQRVGMGSNSPLFIDSFLCIGVILHGLSGSRPEIYFLSIPFSPFTKSEIRLSLVYLLSGYYSFLCALAASPYKIFYAAAAVGIIFLSFKIIYRYRASAGSHLRNNRKHSHRL